MLVYYRSSVTCLTTASLQAEFWELAMCKDIQKWLAYRIEHSALFSEIELALKFPAIPTKFSMSDRLYSTGYSTVYCTVPVQYCVFSLVTAVKYWIWSDSDLILVVSLSQQLNNWPSTHARFTSHHCERGLYTQFSISKPLTLLNHTHITVQST